MDWFVSGVLPRTETLLFPVGLFGAALLLALLARASLRRAQRLTPPQVQEKLDAGMDMLVLDTRSAESFARGHIATSVNVPLATLRAALVDACSVLPADRERLIVVVAESRPCLKRGVDRLRRAGYTRVCVVEGGMREWCADRLPVCMPDGAATQTR